jgi:hypothetical protein
MHLMFSSSRVLGNSPFSEGESLWLWQNERLEYQDYPETLGIAEHCDSWVFDRRFLVGWCWRFTRVLAAKDKMLFGSHRECTMTVASVLQNLKPCHLKSFHSQFPFSYKKLEMLILRFSIVHWHANDRDLHASR